MIFFYYQILPRPSTSTLFPYTTLFRSRHIKWRRPIASLNYMLSSHVWRQDLNGFSHQDPGFIDHVVNKKRSEEHTSELQSRPHLVCRLLLEKKKRKSILTAIF